MRWIWIILGISIHGYIEMDNKMLFQAPPWRLWTVRDEGTPAYEGKIRISVKYRDLPRIASEKPLRSCPKFSKLNLSRFLGTSISIQTSRAYGLQRDVLNFKRLDHDQVRLIIE